MQYMLMFYETPDDRAAQKDARAPQLFASWKAYIGAIVAAGAFRNGDGLLLPETATTLRVRGGERQVQDGPFADTKEQLGGYVIVEVDNLDAALDWAARAPCAATCGVEVRPVMPPLP